MDVFSIIGLLGGLAMFLYGMRLMSSTLKESSSGAREFDSLNRINLLQTA